MEQIGTFVYRDRRLDIYRYQYPAGGRFAVHIDWSGKPYCLLSVDLPEKDLGNGEFFVQHWKLQPSFLNALLETGLFEDTGRRATYHFVRDIPCWRLKCWSARRRTRRPGTTPA